MKLTNVKNKLKKIGLLTLTLALSFSAFSCGGTATTEKDFLFGRELSALSKQVDILSELNKGSCDIGFMDSVMANYYMGSGSDFSNSLQLIDDFILSTESYGIATKKGNKALMSKVNEAIIALSKNGGLTEVANEFGLASEMLVTPETVDNCANATDASFDEVVEDEKVIIGYTVFKPIAFEDKGELTGFDIELARAVFENINTTYESNIEIEFLVIDWNNKEAMLENGSLDLVWNGLSINPTRLEEMEIGVPYMRNNQVGIIRKADEALYGNYISLLSNINNAIIACEEGSTSHTILTTK